MNGIDAFVVLTLGIGLFTGFRKGFIKSFAGLIGIGISIWVGLNFSGLLEGYVSEYDAIPESTIKIVALVVTILLVFVSIKLISKAVHGIVHTVGLGLINRMGGAVFSLLLNVLALSAVFYYLEPFLGKLIDEETLKESISLPYLLEVADFLKLNLF